MRAMPIGSAQSSADRHREGLPDHVVKAPCYSHPSEWMAYISLWATCSTDLRALPACPIGVSISQRRPSDTPASLVNCESANCEKIRHRAREEAHAGAPTRCESFGSHTGFTSQIDVGMDIA